MADGAGFGLSGARARAVVRRLGARGMALVGAGLALIAVLAFTGHWAVFGRYQVSTGNAYVRADITHLSAKVEGYVRTLPVLENQSVRAGDVLVEIDRTDYEAQLALARAQLAQAQGALVAERADTALAQADVRRYRPLAERGMLSPARMQQIEIQAGQAGGALQSARAAVEAAQAQLESAELNLDRTTIRAPIDGVIGDRQVQIGQLVRPGAPLMSVVPMSAIYVIANFKETQIAHVQPGQPVMIAPDVSHGLRLRGVVDSLAPASGSEFSIIPTDTATGNFTKIVQRVPVRIAIEPGQAGVELLRSGMSATVTVDTRE